MLQRDRTSPGESGVAPHQFDGLETLGRLFVVIAAIVLLLGGLVAALALT